MQTANSVLNFQWHQNPKKLIEILLIVQVPFKSVVSFAWLNTILECFRVNEELFENRLIVDIMD